MELILSLHQIKCLLGTKAQMEFNAYVIEQTGNPLPEYTT